ncbi:hypothetical protein ACIQPR_31665 [Streptomyces sp. NPDC091280]|uniref:hypothetical protein n=1 Tax=Streptomyces sp. NPDC091280 TaxID=3365984 RepID=UPI0037F10DE5
MSHSPAGPDLTAKDVELGARLVRAGTGIALTALAARPGLLALPVSYGTASARSG